MMSRKHEIPSLECLSVFTFAVGFIEKSICSSDSNYNFNTYILSKNNVNCGRKCKLCRTVSEISYRF